MWLSFFFSFLRTPLYISNMNYKTSIYAICNDTVPSSECLRINWMVQMAYLEDWVSVERDHTSSLAGAIGDLQSSTLRLPVCGGARVCLSMKVSEIVVRFEILLTRSLITCFCRQMLKL